MKKILIAGASGFVGSRLARYFLLKGYPVTGIGTSPTHALVTEFQDFDWVSADTTTTGDWQNKVRLADIIINLTGRTIFNYWTQKYKQAIYDSRILTTRNIVGAIEKGKTKQLLTTSAVGFYGNGKEQLLTEQSPSGEGFLAQVSIDWEQEALKAVQKDVIVSVMRLGVVLGDGGALSKMVPAFKFFVGGPLGSGHQWFPWIHIKDVENAAGFILENETLEGVFNFVAPELVRQKQFAQKMGKVLARPACMPAPAFVVKMIMGELGQSLLESQRVTPARLKTAGYYFLFDDLHAALNDILGK